MRVKTRGKPRAREKVAQVEPAFAKVAALSRRATQLSRQRSARSGHWLHGEDGIEIAAPHEIAEELCARSCERVSRPPDWRTRHAAPGGGATALTVTN